MNRKATAFCLPVSTDSFLLLQQLKGFYKPRLFLLRLLETHMPDTQNHSDLVGCVSRHYFFSPLLTTFSCKEPQFSEVLEQN